MKKIVYLHGLKSTPGGDKVSFLEKENIVYAPRMDYKDPTTYKKVLDEVAIILLSLFYFLNLDQIINYCFWSNDKFTVLAILGNTASILTFFSHEPIP